MTKIHFHYNAADPLKLASVLTETFFKERRRVLIYAPAPNRYTAIDKALWAFKQLSFIPHCDADSDLANETPVLLVSDEHNLPTHDVLISLSDDVPSFFSQFLDVVDIVGCTEEEKAPGRIRYKFYYDRGYPMDRYDHEGN